MNARKMRLIAVVGLALMLTFVLAGGAVAARPEPTAPPPQDIERGVFVDHGYSSPLWYPPAEETDRYQWAPKIYWADSDLPLDFTVYTLGAPSGAFGAVTPAFAEWDEYTSTEIYNPPVENYVDDPPSVEVRDEENTMSWDVIDGPGGIIAVCYYWYWVNTKKLIEVDIVFDKDETWGIGSGSFFDIQNIATHELGHTLVLGDLRSPKDGALTMHAYTWLGDITKRDLGSGDILGIRAIYGE